MRTSTEVQNDKTIGRGHLSRLLPTLATHSVYPSNTPPMQGAVQGCSGHTNNAQVQSSRLHYMIKWTDMLAGRRVQPHHLPRVETRELVVKSAVIDLIERLAPLRELCVRR